MEDLTSWPDDKPFKSLGEQPGSQQAYWRDLAVLQQTYALDQRVPTAQIAAADAQVKAAEATVTTAYWTPVFAVAVAIAIVLAGIGVWIVL